MLYNEKKGIVNKCQKKRNDIFVRLYHKTVLLVKALQIASSLSTTEQTEYLSTSALFVSIHTHPPYQRASLTQWISSQACSKRICRFVLAHCAIIIVETNTRDPSECDAMRYRFGNKIFLQARKRNEKLSSLPLRMSY